MDYVGEKVKLGNLFINAEFFIQRIHNLSRRSSEKEQSHQFYLSILHIYCPIYGSWFIGTLIFSFLVNILVESCVLLISIFYLLIKD